MLLGPYLDQANTPVIIAKTATRFALDAILMEDIYFTSQQAKYTIRAFNAAMTITALDK